MANFSYVLMLKDLGSGLDRERLDDTLAGKITIRTDLAYPELSSVPNEGDPIIPNARNMEELREMWGRNPSAIREKLLFDQTVKNLPRQKPER